MKALRIRYSKLGKIRFTSHRDVARIWERSLRRSQIPIAYTEGFAPRPKLSFGLALSTGYESLGEYLDVFLRPEEAGDLDLAEVPDRLAAGLPEGIEVQAVVPLDAGAESLQQTVTSCTWHIEIGGVGPADVQRTLDVALAATELPLTRERKGRTVTDDVRPAVVSAHVIGPTDGPHGPGTTIEVELGTQPRALRPAELIAAICPPDAPWPLVRVLRVHQWTQAGGARREVLPLPSAATPPPHAEVRAS
ncbi:MAG TPA: TIGR03936 family radical SAM-associated protein [Acidimicrobiales bacterium]